MSTGMSPGEGVLFGLAWGERANAKDFAAERARLAKQMEQANADAMGNLAAKGAAKAVLNAVVSELAAEEQGRLPERRLSDPANVAARNNAFVATAEGELGRLSDGSAAFSRTAMERLRRSTVDVAQVLVAEPSVMRVERKPRKP